MSLGLSAILSMISKKLAHGTDYSSKAEPHFPAEPSIPSGIVSPMKEREIVKILLQIMKTELLLIAKSKFTYIIAILFVFIGIWQATSIRWNPAGIWSFVCGSSIYVSLILVFWALGQGLRKQDKYVSRISR